MRPDLKDHPLDLLFCAIFEIGYDFAMPSRNSQKMYDVPAYYHVYNRGAGKRTIFHDAGDKAKFLSLLARHLDPDNEAVRGDGVPYEKYPVELVAYCLMGNHFHLLLYQADDPEAIQRLMRSVGTAYSMYYNLRYRSSGHLFQGIYKAVHIDNEPYLAHISRYIHLNPRTYMTYKWSSLPEFLDKRTTSWVYPERVLSALPGGYKAFLEDYEDRAELLKSIREEFEL